LWHCPCHSLKKKIKKSYLRFYDKKLEINMIFSQIKEIRIKNIPLVITATLCLFLTYSHPVSAQNKGFGIGFIVGEPTGLSAKLWTSPQNAFDFGLGWSFGGDRISNFKGTHNGSRIHFHMDYLWHSFNAIQSTERFPLYYGIGGRFNAGGGYDNSFGVRGVFGIAWLPHSTPLDVFLEVVPVLQLVRSTTFGLDAGLGMRFYFK